MEIIICHAQRNLLAFASSRSSLFLTKHFPLKKPSVSSLSTLHKSAEIKSQPTNAQNAPLNLKTLESKPKFQKKIKLFNPSKLKTSPKPQTETKVTKPPKTPKDLKTDETNITKPQTIQKELKIDESLFSAESFADLKLPPLLLSNLQSSNFTVPTEVQATAVPTIAQNHDVIIQSYTGSGKTLAYLLPILSQVGPLQENQENQESDRKQQGIEAVIVAPSRELAMQIVREFERLLGPTHKRLVQQLVGGANRSRQEEGLKKNKPLIVVGTPGRIAEISTTGKLHTHNCRFLVLDEVDQLLSFNYREDMHRIIEHVGRKKTKQSSDIIGPLVRRSERQTIMVSATVPFSVIRAAMSWAHEPVLVRGKTVISLNSLNPQSENTVTNTNGITQGTINSLPPSLDHYFSLSKAQHKVDTLRRCIHALNAQTVIVFMNNTKPIKDVVHKLSARGITASELHGDLPKLTRSTILTRFKSGEIRVLVTNELSARGLDVPNCDLVVNFDLPTDSVHYAHRAGRTGRLGRKGSVVSVCEEREEFVVHKLGRQLGVGIRVCEFRDGRMVVREEREREGVGFRV